VERKRLAMPRDAVKLLQGRGKKCILGGMNLYNWLHDISRGQGQGVRWREEKDPSIGSC